MHYCTFKIMICTTPTNPQKEIISVTCKNKEYCNVKRANSSYWYILPSIVKKGDLYF